jgi:hypothetical protein
VQKELEYLLIKGLDFHKPDDLVSITEMETLAYSLLDKYHERSRFSEFFDETFKEHYKKMISIVVILLVLFVGYTNKEAIPTDLIAIDEITTTIIILLIVGVLNYFGLLPRKENL